MKQFIDAEFTSICLIFDLELNAHRRNVYRLIPSSLKQNKRGIANESMLFVALYCFMIVPFVSPVACAPLILN